MKYSWFVLLGILLFSCKEEKQVTNNRDHMYNKFEQADWIHNTIVYEVNVRQYTPEGTINAFAKELPRLKKMGVQTLWFMPLTPIAKKNIKGSLGSPYAAQDYTSVNREFGTIEDFKTLVQQAHSMGMKVIIDWVANHTGWDHHWTKEHPRYYLKDSTTNDFHIASGMDDIIELDYGNPALRKAMIEAMAYWVKQTDIDGFRCDLASWVEVDFWQEAREDLQKIKTLFWLGEFDPIDEPEYMTVFDAAYSWKWMHATEDYYKKDLKLSSLDSLLHQYDTVAGGQAIKLWFTTNHDENSWNGTEYEKYGQLALPLAVFSFTWDGIPLIYSGQELPNMKRLQFFEKDTIAWSGKYMMESFYQSLANLKTNNPALRTGDSTVQTFLLEPANSAKSSVLCFLRKKEGHEVLVLLNMSKSYQKFALNDKGKIKGKYNAVFGNKETIDLTNKQEYSLEPYGYQVFEK